VSTNQRPPHSIAFDVYLYGKNIDTIFYSADANVDADEVKRSLVNHDGYSPDIVVHRRKRERAEADARLIASAPSMLAELTALRSALARKDAALRDLVDYAHGNNFGGECDMCGDCNCTPECVVGAARAALEVKP
jgi:predicted metal-binding protein